MSVKLIRIGGQYTPIDSNSLRVVLEVVHAYAIPSDDILGAINALRYNGYYVECQ